MTEINTSLRRKRPAWEWIAMVGLPVLLNVTLALFLFGYAGNGGLPGFGDPLPLPSEDIGGGLPRPGFDRILADVRERTGRSYSCGQPWRTSDETIAWACREHDSLATLRGLSPTIVFAVEVTWFGFDASATDLPAWAAATFEQPAVARQAAEWVFGHVGQGDATTTIEGVQLRIDGARGALTLSVSR